MTGPGGGGKTRLAQEVAGRLLEAWHGAVWFVPGAGFGLPAGPSSGRLSDDAKRGLDPLELGLGDQPGQLGG